MEAFILIYNILKYIESAGIISKDISLIQSSLSETKASSVSENISIDQQSDCKDANECFRIAGMYYVGQGVSQDYQKSALLYRKACDGGSALGCGLLGFQYYSGQGVVQDNVKAAEFNVIACGSGFSIGCYVLGNQYYQGLGVTQD